MATTLIIAEREDRLACGVNERVHDPILCSESELFGCGRFTLALDGTMVAGSLAIAGRLLGLKQLSGVLYRPLCRWRPRFDLGARDRLFAQHEMRAAWCAMFSALACPVLNRMPPSWWADNTFYSASLAHELARKLELPVSYRASQSGEISSLYLVGSHVIFAGNSSSALRQHFEGHADQIAIWQRETGIVFSQIDITFESGPLLKHIDPLPRMEDASDALLERISTLVSESLK